MEKCTSSQSRRAWWIWKLRNILEAFFHKRSLFFHTSQKLLSTHCWRQNFRSWVHQFQRGNSLHLHAPIQNLERTKTDHVPSQSCSQYFTYLYFTFRARITDTDVCPLCNLKSQSLKHMLITCSVSSSFWTCFSNWWHEKFNQKLTLSESTILYGWCKESNNWEVLNHCLIVAKYNVFATRVCNGVLDFDSFLLRLNNKIDILGTVAFRSNRLSQFKKTWAKLL